LQGPAGISHAAGAYQFEPKTWAAYAEPLGIHDFSPESQDKVAAAAFADQGWKPWAPYNKNLYAAAQSQGLLDPTNLRINPAAKASSTSPNAAAPIAAASSTQTPSAAGPGGALPSGAAPSAANPNAGLPMTPEAAQKLVQSYTFAGLTPPAYISAIAGLTADQAKAWGAVAPAIETKKGEPRVMRPGAVERVGNQTTYTAPQLVEGVDANGNSVKRFVAPPLNQVGPNGTPTIPQPVNPGAPAGPVNLMPGQAPQPNQAAAPDSIRALLGLPPLSSQYVFGTPNAPSNAGSIVPPAVPNLGTPQPGQSAINPIGGRPTLAPPGYRPPAATSGATFGSPTSPVGAAGAQFGPVAPTAAPALTAPLAGSATSGNDILTKINPANPFAYSFSAPVGKGPGQDSSIMVQPSSEHPMPSIIPPVSKAAPIVGSQVSTEADQKNWSETNAQWAKAQTAIPLAQQRISAISQILTKYESGSFAEHLSDIVAAMRAGGIRVPENVANDPALAQALLKNNMGESLAIMQATGLPRFTQNELAGQQKSFANPDLQPTANFEILAQTQGLLAQQNAQIQDWAEAKKQGWRDPNDFERAWLANNPAQRYVDIAKAQIGPLAGMTKSDISGTMPKTSTQNGQKFVQSGGNWYPVGGQ